MDSHVGCRSPHVLSFAAGGPCVSTVAFHDRPIGATAADIETREIEEIVQSMVWGGYLIHLYHSQENSFYDRPRNIGRALAGLLGRCSSAQAMRADLSKHARALPRSGSRWTDGGDV